MSFDATIRDPGTSKGAGVNAEGRLLVEALSVSAQQHEAVEHGEAYQVVGEAQPNNNTVVVLHLRNTSTTRNMVVTFIRVQLIASGGTAFPATAHYVELNYGQEYASGGTAEVATNTNAGSSNVADATVYDNNPTLSGTAVQVDKQFFQSNGDVIVYNKQGSMVISPGKDVDVSVTTDHTTATALARVSFLMVDKETL